MANSYYDHTTYPVANSPGSSQALRNEFDAVEAGFDKLPSFTGNAGKIVYVNVAENALGVLSTTGTGNVVLAGDPTFTLTDLTTNNASTTAHGWMKKLSGVTTDYFRGDGNWTRLPIPTVFDRSTNTILDATNTGALVNFTAGFTQTVTAAATLGNGWSVLLKNGSTADVTIDPNGTETIDGATTLVMRPGDARLVTCDGANFRSVAISGNPGRVLLATVVPTNGAAAVNFLTTFSSLYDAYEIDLEEMMPNANDNLYLQFAVAGTAVTSGYGTVANGTTASLSDTFISVLGANITSTGRGLNALITVQNVNSITGLRSALIEAVGDVGVSGITGATRQAVYSTTGSVVSGFRLFWNLGSTFVARGAIRVYGIRKNI